MLPDFDGLSFFNSMITLLITKSLKAWTVHKRGHRKAALQISF